MSRLIKTEPSMVLPFYQGDNVLNSLSKKLYCSRGESGEVATRINAKGLIEKVPANGLRLDYDPITKECKGLLVEEQRTNMITYSEDLSNILWTKDQTTVIPNATLAPDGTLTADKLVEDSSTNIHTASFPTTNFLADTSYVISIHAKEGDFANFQIRARIDGGSIPILAICNANTGVITPGSGQTVGSKYVGNGWWRFWVIFTNPDLSPVTNTARIYLRDGSTYAGDELSGMYFWGAMVEQGSFPTSYIPSNTQFTSRASIGTYFDSNGELQTALANEPRYDHAYVNGKWVSKGLLLESSKTNICTYSEN